MASAIDATKPVGGVPAVKADLRTNLLTAKNEITALQDEKVEVSDQANNQVTAGAKVWVGTQAHYDALTPDSNTIYHIVP